MILNWPMLLSLVIGRFDHCSIKHVKQLWQSKILLFLCLLGAVNLFAIRSVLSCNPFFVFSLFIFWPYSSKQLIWMVVMFFWRNYLLKSDKDLECVKWLCMLTVPLLFIIQWVVPNHALYTELPLIGEILFVIL